MNRRKTLLTTSLLTLVFGVAPASLWLYRHKFSGGKRSNNSLSLAEAQVVAASTRQSAPVDLEKIFTKGNKLSYKGYSIEKSLEKQEGYWFATLKRGERVVARFENGGEQEYWTNFGLFSFLGNDAQQLIVEQYSGGAHCCYTYSLYDLGSDGRLIFETEKFGTGNALTPVDVDGDGQLELVHSVMAFDYFHASHASSVFPEAVFSFDKKSGEYRPANDKLSAYVLRDLKDDIKELETLKAEKSTDEPEIYSERYFSAVLQVTLKYIYAGKREEGWAYFNQEYKPHEGISKEKMRAEIAEQLQREPVYQYIYSNKPE
jgi:hypothetical protein